MRGAFIVHPPADKPRPFHMIASSARNQAKMMAAEYAPQVLMLTDWDRATAWSLVQNYALSGITPTCHDAILLNGRGNQFCPTQDYLTSPEIMAIFGGGSNLTDRGCLDQSYGFLNDGEPVANTSFSQVLEGEFSGCSNTSNVSLPFVSIDHSDA